MGIDVGGSGNCDVRANEGRMGERGERGLVGRKGGSAKAGSRVKQ